MGSNLLLSNIDNINKKTGTIKGIISGFGELNTVFEKMSKESGTSSNTIGALSHGIKTLTTSMKESASTGQKFSEVLTKNLGNSASAASALMFGTTVAIGAAVTAIYGAAKLADLIIVTHEEQAQTVAELEDKYTSLQSEISSVNSELNTTNDRMKELSSQPTLTFVESEELTKLQEANEELKVQLALLERQEEVAARKLAQESIDLYKKGYGKNSFSQGKIDKYTTSAETTGSYAVLMSDEKDIVSLVVAYRQIVDLKKQATDTSMVEQYSDFLSFIEESLLTSSKEIQGIYDNLSALKNPTADEKAALDEVGNSLKHINAILVPEEILNSIFSKEQFTAVREELEILASQGQLSADTIKDGYSNLDSELESVGITAGLVADYFNNIAQIKFDTTKDSLSQIKAVLDDMYTPAGENRHDLLRPLYETIEKLAPEKINLLAQYLDKTDKSGKEAIETFIRTDKSIKNMSVDKFASSLSSITKIIIPLDGGINKLEAAIGDWNNAQTEAEKTFRQSQIQEILKNLREEAEKGTITWEEYEINVRMAEMATTSFSDAVDNLDKKIDTAQSDIGYLNKTIDTLSKNNSLTADETMDLIQKYPQLSDKIKQTADGYTIETDVLNTLRLTKISEFETAIKSEVEKTRQTLESSKTRLSAYNLEISAIKDLATAQAEVSKLGFNKVYGDMGNVKFDEANLTFSTGDEVLKLTREEFSKYKTAYDDQKQANDNLLKLGQLYESANASIEMLNNKGLGVSDSSSKKNTAIDKLLADQKFYNEQLKDLEESLKESDTTIANLESSLSKAEATGNEEHISKLNDKLLEAKNERTQIYQDILTETQRLKDEIQTTFSEFSNIELSNKNIELYKQNLENQITNLQNKNSKTDNDAITKNNNLAIQGLEQKLSLFNEYATAMQNANSQEEKFLSEIQKLETEIHNQRIVLNDKASNKEIENLNKAYEKTGDITNLRAELVKLSEDENISETQRLAILDKIGDLDNEMSKKAVENLFEIYDKTADIVTLRKELLLLSEAENISHKQKLAILKKIENIDLDAYNRKISDIEFGEFFLKSKDYDGIISANLDKIAAAREHIAYLLEREDAYTVDSEAVRSLLKDVHTYESNIVEAKTTQINNLYKGMQKAAVEAIDAEIKALEKLKKSKDKAIEQLKEELALLEKKKANYDSALSAINAVIDKEIEKLNEQKEALQDVTKEQKEHLELLKEELALLEKQKADRDRAISAVVSVVDNEIYALNEQKKALEELNKEKENQIKLEELQENLRKAKENRTIRVFKEGEGWVYEADQKAIDEAQKAMDGFNHQEQLDAIQAQIDAWNEYKDLWTSLADIFEKEQDRIIAAQLMGERWEQDILLKRKDTLEQFTDDYYNLNKQIELDVKSRISTLEEEVKEVEKATQKQLTAIDLQIKGWEKYKQQWSKTVDQYKNDQDRLMAIQLLGANWEADILAQRQDTVQVFADEYYRLNVKIEEDVKKRIETLEEEKKALEESANAQIENLNNLKDAWSNALDIEDEATAFKGQLSDLVGAESASYESRLSAIKDFIEKYKKLQKEANSLSSYSSTSDKGNSGNSSGSDGTVLNSDEVKQAYIDSMKKNSAAWAESYSEDPEGSSSYRDSLAKANEDMGTSQGWTKDPSSGVWYDEKGVRLYAKGTKSSRNECAIVDEEDKELIIRKPHNGRLTHLEAGDAVVPAPLTEKIFELAENPTKVINDDFKSHLRLMSYDNPEDREYLKKIDTFGKALKANHYDPGAIAREEYEKKHNAFINSTINNITHNRNQQQIVTNVNFNGGINLPNVNNSNEFATTVADKAKTAFTQVDYGRN